MNKKILILGGDLRQFTVASEFKKDGFDVSVYGFDKNTPFVPFFIYNNLKDAIKDSDIIIMGIPISRDNVFLSAPYSEEDIKISEIINCLDSSKIVFGGIISKDIEKSLIDKDVLNFDYGVREELNIENVIPTVEGALSIAINETPYTLHGANVLVTGFGRIGKILSKALASLGAFVTVSARKTEDLSWIDCFSYKKIKTQNICDNINKYDIIFNTIPFTVIDEECLKRVKKNAVIIDLASKPGGVNFKYAHLLNLKVIHALSLPGKVAPETAGKIIKNTINNILSELGVKIWGI